MIGRAALLALLAVAQPAVADAAGIEYPAATPQYSMPEPLPFKATRAEIDQLDADTKALVEQLRAGSPTAVELAGRAHGALIFPRVEKSNYFLLGETKALGVLYVRDATGAYAKSGYYFAERNSLGFVAGSETSSRVILFLNPKTLEEFVAGDVTASYRVVNPDTGESAGDADADVAILITNVEGDARGLGFEGLKIVPVSFIE
jgi:lipid-binding SYLF domain-containing protein